MKHSFNNIGYKKYDGAPFTVGRMEYKLDGPALIRIETIMPANLKPNICYTILSALPSWFGNKDAIIDYTNKVQQMPFYAVYDSEKAVGFVAINLHNKYTAEICVMGVLEDYQNT